MNSPIANIPRGKLRYALFRCKTQTPDSAHSDVLNFYEPMLSEYGLGIEDFAVEWDISKESTDQIVTGKIARHYNHQPPLVAPTL